MSIPAPIAKVPAGLLCRADPNDAESVMALYAAPETYAALIKQVGDACGVTAYHLGQLVGLKHPPVIFRWKSGKPGSRRPSILYVLRMLELVILETQAPGKVFWIKSINWQTGKIRWKDGVPWADDDSN